MLNRNNLFVKLFIALYLVSIYVEYVYVFKYVYHESTRKCWQICIFMFSLLSRIDNGYNIKFISNTKL